MNLHSVLKEMAAYIAENNPSEEPTDELIEEIECTPGCLCCACVHQGEGIDKRFNDTVICYQKREKSIRIEVI